MARFVLALACSLLALGGCQARRLLASTAGETLNGYKFASDVSGERRSSGLAVMPAC